MTPVVLPGFTDGNHDKAVQLLMKALAFAGISEESIEDFYLRPAPYWTGSLSPLDYRRIPRHLKDSPRFHVYLEFKEKTFGPVAIGKGRFCGLGLFARV